MSYSKFSVPTIHLELRPVQLSVSLNAKMGFALLQEIVAVIMTGVDSIARFVSVQVTYFINISDHEFE